MASPSIPSFELDDQTDEDFFDKLVEDDVEGVSDGVLTEPVQSKGDEFADGSDSDETKALANLSISEVNKEELDFGAKVVSDGDAAIGNLDTEEKVRPIGESSTLVTSNSFSFDNGNAADGSLQSELKSDLAATQSLDSSFSGIKLWGAFTDTATHESEGFGGDDIDFGEWGVQETDDVVENPSHLVTSNSYEVVKNPSQPVASNSYQGVENPGQSVTLNSSSHESGIVQDHPVQTSEVKSEVTSAVDGAEANSGVKVVNWSAFTDETTGQRDAFGSYSDFFSELGTSEVDDSNDGSKVAPGSQLGMDANVQDYSHSGYQAEQVSAAPAADQTANGQDPHSMFYWESQYPGWKYDQISGQWYPDEGYQAATNLQQTQDVTTQVQQNMQENLDPSMSNYWGSTQVNLSQSYYAQNTSQSVSETVGLTSGTTENAANWNHVSQGTTDYPAHMIFDPQYPGWYFDSTAYEWRSLEAYHSTLQSNVQTEQQVHDGYTSTTMQSHDNYQVLGSHGKEQTEQQVHNSYTSTTMQSHDNYQVLGSHGKEQTLAPSYSGYDQQGISMWQPAVLSVNLAGQNSLNPNISTNTFMPQQIQSSSMRSPAAFNRSQDNGFFSEVDKVPSFMPISAQPLTLPSESNGSSYAHTAAVNYRSPDSYNTSQQLIPNGYGGSYEPKETRSADGRPPHALVSFGFGGKVLVMKTRDTLHSPYGTKGTEGQSVSILNVAEVVSERQVGADMDTGACSYFHALFHQSFSGPLIGGNSGGKEVNKWVDERMLHCDAPDTDYEKGKALKLLLSLLKIACQHYGKLRSRMTDSGIRESELPESAVARLFSSSKGTDMQFGRFDAPTNCLMLWPSEAQIQATASEVQNLLVSGRKMEALQCAQEGQWWSFALILARELGDQFYANTVKQMALSQFVPGAPLRTLSLLVAKNPEVVFSVDTSTVAGSLPGSGHAIGQSAQPVGNTILDSWAENLAVITANRTENDHLVITHLGDCLWKEKGNITAAHICYLIAEADFESYSNSSRLCLIGADHWSFPRSYASPEAIQRTEIFEYSKVMGNPQYVLLTFQPYKLLYAYMLAEVGKVSESLKYCQAVHKSLKTGRSPEVETWKQLLLSLEDRIKTHQQGGYAVNLAPAKVVGKLRSFFDSTAQKVIGPPPPVPLAPQSNGTFFQKSPASVSNSQSMMAIATLSPSNSMEPISQWAASSNRMTMQNRSISEPDISRTPMQPVAGRPNFQPDTNRSLNQPDMGTSQIQDQAIASNETAPSKAQSKGSDSTNPSRSSRFSFGAQLLQKTVGLVFKARQDKQAKLGSENKFYYDEKLKRWVEEGAPPPAEEPALAPPPTTAAFQNPSSGYNVKDALNERVPDLGSKPDFGSPTIPSSSSSGAIPSLPPTANKFSARARMGVRSRYVDTFNKGGAAGNPASSFQTPIVPLMKPANVNPANFFVPTPTLSSSGDDQSQSQPQPQETNSTNNQEPFEGSLSPMTMGDPFQTNTQEAFERQGNPSPVMMSEPLQRRLSATPPPMMQRFPSVDNIPERESKGHHGNGPVQPLARRTASWGGGSMSAFMPSPSGFVPSQAMNNSLPSAASEPIPSPANMAIPSGNLEGDLDEVEL